MPDEDGRTRRKIDPDLSLASRLVNARIRDWIKLKIGLALATSEEEDHPGIQRAEDCLFTSYQDELEPQILRDLRLAGLLKPAPEEDASREH